MSNAPNYRLPVKREPSPPPVPLWQQAAPAVVQGAALVAIGVIGEWLLRSAARRAAGPLTGRKAAKTRAVAKPEAPRPGTVVAVSETVVIQRTVIRQE